LIRQHSHHGFLERGGSLAESALFVYDNACLSNMAMSKRSGGLLVGERPARKELEKLLEKPLTLRPSFLNFPPQSSGREDRTISPLRLLK
jgi:hypothetical protein